LEEPLQPAEPLLLAQPQQSSAELAAVEPAEPLLVEPAAVEPLLVEAAVVEMPVLRSRAPPRVDPASQRLRASRLL
jgi:hypothetical protein